jgi:hypothetical protein
VDTDGEYGVGAALADIGRRFERAVKILGNGLHLEYCKTYDDREAPKIKLERASGALDRGTVDSRGFSWLPPQKNSARGYPRPAPLDPGDLITPGLTPQVRGVTTGPGI